MYVTNTLHYKTLVMEQIDSLMINFILILMCGDISIYVRKKLYIIMTISTIIIL